MFQAFFPNLVVAIVFGLVSSKNKIIFRRSRLSFGRTVSVEGRTAEAIQIKYPNIFFDMAQNNPRGKEERSELDRRM